MRRILIIATLLVAVTATTRPAAAAFSTGCCACLDERAQTSQLPPAEADALFCGLVTGRGYPEFVQRCEGLGGSEAPCFEPLAGASCSAALAAEGIRCPAAPGAPAAGAWGLGALALSLTALGAWAARRRAR